MCRYWLARLLCVVVLILGLHSADSVDRVMLEEFTYETTCAFETDTPERFFFDERDTNVATLPRVQVGNTSASNRTVNLSRHRSVASAATYHPQAVASSTLRGGTPSAHTSCVVPPLGLSGAEYHIFALRRIVI